MSRPVHVTCGDTKGTVYRLWEGWSYVEDICTLTIARRWQIKCSQQTMQCSEKHGASWAFFLSWSLFSNNTVNWKDYIASLIDEWMSMKNWRNDNDRGNMNYWEKNPSHCHFVHHKFHMKLPGIEYGLQGKRRVGDSLCHGMVLMSFPHIR